RQLTTTGRFVTLDMVNDPPATEIFVFCTFVVHPIMLMHLNTLIDHDKRPKTISRKIRDHLSRMVLIALILSKALIIRHIVAVEINSIAGYLTFTEFISNLPYIRFWIITPTTLMIANGPYRRHIVGASQFVISLYNVHHLRPVEVIVLQFSSLRPIACLIRSFGRKVKISLKSVIEKNTIGIAACYTNIKRNGFI